MKEMVILKNPYGGFSRMIPELAEELLKSNTGYELAGVEDVENLEDILKSDRTAQGKAEAINEYSSK